jgi:Ca2+-binding RTX toxin-like protein
MRRDRNRRARPTGAALASIAAAGVLLCAPAAARAAEAAIVTGPSGVKTLSYRAGAGEINQVSLNLQGANYTIQDSGGPPITAIPPCSPWPLMPGTGTGATCPAVDVERIAVDLGDQTDQLVIGGISRVLLPATIRGGAGADRMDGGEGGDTIDAFDQTADAIGCHAGNDTVYADRLDSVAGDCETVKHEPATGLDFGQSPTDVSEDFAVSVAVARAYRLAAALKRLRLRVGCSTGCTIETRLLLDRRRARRLGVGNGTKDVEVGRAQTTTLPTAGDTTVVIKLTRRAKRAFRRLRHLTLTVETRATGSVRNAVTLRTPVTLRRQPR